MVHCSHQVVTGQTFSTKIVSIYSNSTEPGEISLYAAIMVVLVHVTTLGIVVK